MITHGNKQISEIVYARKASEGGGAVRLTNIIRGAQVVFGGLYPLWRLTDATKAAILAAFGQTDGKAVIKATNAYLNGIAATDPTKASALAGFINEDPMLVCSLGLQPQGVEMPIRWLVGNGNVWINTGVKTSANTIFEMQIQYLEVVSSSQFNGVFSSDHRMQLGSTKEGFGIGYGSLHITIGENKPNIIHTAMIDGNQKKGFYNGKEFNFASASFNANKSFNIYLFARLTGDTNELDAFCKERVAYSKIEDYNVKLHLIPYNNGTESGMIDTITGTFYPNANTSGSFTIEYTLPDGTPWTPLNQNP